TASDPVRELVSAAKEARSADAYAIASGTNLPFADARFDLVMAYNVLMDVDDVPATLKEIRRVLRPAGVLVISIVHPFSDRGHFATTEATSPFVIQDGYFGCKPFEATEERDGLKMRFAGWSRPLEAYATALEDAGLAITSLREPVPQTGEGSNRMQRWTRIPLFLWLKARPVEVASRIGSIFWYSGESYQRFTAAASANSRMTTRFGSGPPSISWVAPPRVRYRPPYCASVAG